MKKSWLVVLLAGALVVLWCSSLFAQWLPDMRLTFDNNDSKTSYGNTRCIAVQGNTVHVVWKDNRDHTSYYQVFYKRSTDYGVTWGLDNPITPLDKNVDQPSIAVSGTYIHVAWVDVTDYTIKFIRSTNGGADWGPDIKVLSPTVGGLAPLTLAASGSYVYVVFHSALYDFRFMRNWNNGEYNSWGSPVPVSVYNSGHWGPSVAAADGGVVHVTWQDTRNNYPTWEMYYNRSTDNGVTWQLTDTPLSSIDGKNSYGSSVTASGPNVNAVWWDYKEDNKHEIFANRSADAGETWGTATRLTYNAVWFVDNSYPSVTASGSDVHLVWPDYRHQQGGDYNWEIYYKYSSDGGVSWDPDTRLTENTAYSHFPSVAPSSNGVAHVVWTDARNGDYSHNEIYYKRGGGSGGGGVFPGCLTESSQGRHMVRDPATGTIHLVMHTDEASPRVYYTKTTDGGVHWDSMSVLGNGKYPTVGLAWDLIGGPYVCVAYQPYPPVSGQLKYQWLDLSGWHPGYIPTPANPSQPALVTVGSRVYVAFMAGGSNKYVYCQDFDYNAPTSYLRTLMDNTANCSQPCLAVDGNGKVYGAWRRPGTGNDTQIWYAPRGTKSPYWSSKLRVDWTTDPSQQPSVECYGDSVFVAWSDGQPSPSDVWRASKRLTDLTWYQRINVSSSSNPSESPTQAWREFTTWSEGTSDEPPMMFDINYWRPSGLTDVVESNPAEWSYWTHSQMRYPNPGINTDLWSAWTESPNAGQPPYRVLFKHTIFPFFGPGLGGELSDYGNYYKVLAGQDSASPYCRKRDGVMRFADKAVDFARDSLVYELPYLDPVYDYFVRVASYREAGSDWVQGLSVNAGPARTVRFAPNLVDTAWVRIPPEAYEKDRKVSFSLKNVRGDYVTGLSLTLFQRDPKRGKGGPQAGEPVTQPVMREVFAVYPNPVKGQAQIEYSLKTPSSVRLGIYDVTGRLVREVVNGAQPAGVHKATWDGKNVNGHQAPSGIYFLKLNSPGVNKTARFVVIR